MCKQVICPNDGLPTWWGCGGHIEIALAGVPPAGRCGCEHVPVPGRPGMYEVPKREEGEGVAIHPMSKSKPEEQ